MRRRPGLVAAMLLPATSGWAQDEPEYRMEVGAAAGLLNYTGDFNGNLLKGRTTLPAAP